MASLQIFLSVVFVVRNQASELERMLIDAAAVIRTLVNDYEIIVVDNASNDESVSVLKALTGVAGLPNLQIFSLTKEVDADSASWVGVENALGDYVAVADNSIDNINFLPTMVARAVAGSDVVFAKNTVKAPLSLGYRVSYAAFNFLYKRFNGIDLAKEAPLYRVLTKRVVNFILQHPRPALTYRHLPATGGFSKANLEYSAPSKSARIEKNLADGFDRGVRLIVSTTRAPMRLVTWLLMFGAAVNLVYSVYIILVAIFRQNIAPGWVTLSLQQSGMFFLISLVLIVLGEYISHIVGQNSEGPTYHVAQEFTSAVMTRREKLNIESIHAEPAELHNDGKV